MANRWPFVDITGQRTLRLPHEQVEFRRGERREGARLEEGLNLCACLCDSHCACLQFLDEKLPRAYRCQALDLVLTIGDELLRRRSSQAGNVKHSEWVFDFIPIRPLICVCVARAELVSCHCPAPSFLEVRRLREARNDRGAVRLSDFDNRIDTILLYSDQRNVVRDGVNSQTQCGVFDLGTLLPLTKAARVAKDAILESHFTLPPTQS